MGQAKARGTLAERILHGKTDRQVYVHRMAKSIAIDARTKRLCETATLQAIDARLGVREKKA